MKLAIVLAAAIAIAPASAQLKSVKQSSPTVAAKPAETIGISQAPPVALPVIGALEKEMDRRLETTGGANPCVLLGQTRGLYVSGLGAVFTAEVELASTPAVGPFQTAISPAQKAKIRKDKMDHVSLLEQSMRDMVLSLAASPTLKLSDTDQIVVAARLVYRPWEDLTGLPGQIVVRMDHPGAAVKMEVQ